MSDPEGTVERLNAELAPWDGSRATMWSYSRAFNTLTLRLSSGQPLGDRHLVCKGTAVVKMPVSVPHCSLRVRLMEDIELGGHPALLVGDEGGVVEVLAATVHLADAS